MSRGRYTSYYNKGGAGTTGASAHRTLSTGRSERVFEPFDWLRLRMTRSRDMRAAGYRDLFLNQPTLPDQATGRNWWRERTEISEENQNERFGYVRVGNAGLTPESSNTLTVCMVLSPGSWGAGHAVLSADYSSIQVSNGIYTPYAFSSAGSIIEACCRESGNTDVEGRAWFPGETLAPNMDLATCREITFHRTRMAPSIRRTSST